MKQVITSNILKMKDYLKKFVLWPGLCLTLCFEAGWTTTRSAPPKSFWKCGGFFTAHETYHTKFNMVSLNLRVKWQIKIKQVDWLPLTGLLFFLSEEGKSCLGTVYFPASKVQYGRAGNTYHRIRWLVWTLIQSRLFSRCIKTLALSLHSLKLQGVE